MVELKPEDAMKILRMDEERLKLLETERQALLTALQEIQSARASLNEFPKGKKEALFPVGAGNFAPAGIGGGKIYVAIGNNVVIEKTLEEALETLDEREKSINDELKKVDESRARVSARAEKVGNRLKAFLEEKRQKEQDADMPVIG